MKTLTFPSGYDAQSIISRSDVGNLTENDNGTISATKVDTMEVRNVLGEDNNNVGLLCRSNKINIWALFKPGRVSIDGSGNIFHDITPVDDPGYSLGDFLGYNHNAVKPSATGGDDNYHEDDTYIELQVSINEGEFNWQEMPNVGYFWIVIKDGDETVDEKSFEIDPANRNQTYSVEVNCNTWSGDKTLDVEFWIGHDSAKEALIDTGQINLVYYKLTDFVGAVLDSDAQMAGYQLETQNATIVVNENKWDIDIKITDPNGNDVSCTIDFEMNYNDGVNTYMVKTGYYYNLNETWASVQGYFDPETISKYGDSWALVLHTDLNS